MIQKHSTQLRASLSSSRHFAPRRALSLSPPRPPVRSGLSALYLFAAITVPPESRRTEYALLEAPLRLLWGYVAI